MKMTHRNADGPTEAVARLASESSDYSNFAVIGAALFQILTPILPALGIGRQIGQQSASVQTLITPAGWTFSIWGLLYAGSLAFAIYQALPTQRGNRLLAKLRWTSAGAFIGNGLWVLYTQLADITFVSVLIILFSLTCILSVYRRLADQRHLTRGDKWFVAPTLSALTAWLTAATIVNIAAAIQYHGVQPEIDGAVLGAAIILVAGAIAAATLWRGKGNAWYALAFLWALGGIYARNGNWLLIAAACAMSALAVGTIVVLAHKRSEVRNHRFGSADAAADGGSLRNEAN